MQLDQNRLVLYPWPNASCDVTVLSINSLPFHLLPAICQGIRCQSQTFHSYAYMPVVDQVLLGIIVDDPEICLR